MINLIERTNFLKVILYLFAISLLSGFNYLEVSGKQLNVETTIEILRALSFPIIVFVAVYYMLGKWIWRLFWRLPVLGSVLKSSFCPDLNGEWVATLKSNTEHEGEDGDEFQILMKIKIDFFQTFIGTISGNDRASSFTESATLSRDQTSGKIKINYIYRATSMINSPSDDSFYLGAASLDVIDENTLLGFYWTNRAWKSNLNTAGTIRVVRADTA